MCEEHLCDGVAPDSIRCCEISTGGEHGGATICEHRAEAECAAHGGVNQGPGACDAQLCGGSMEPDKIRCCVTDEHHGVVCEHRTPGGCAEHGGTNQGSGLCDPSPCG